MQGVYKGGSGSELRLVRVGEGRRGLLRTAPARCGDVAGEGSGAADRSIEGARREARRPRRARDHHRDGIEKFSVQRAKGIVTGMLNWIGRLFRSGPTSGKGDAA